MTSHALKSPGNACTLQLKPPYGYYNISASGRSRLHSGWRWRGNNCNCNYEVVNTLEAQPSLLMPIQDLFKFSVFRVPNYQRGFAWGEQQIGDLLSDLEDLDPGRTHYTGTFVLVKKGEKEKLGETYSLYDIVDGQQRLATIVILLQCLYEQYQKLGEIAVADETADEIARAMREGYIVKGKTEKLVLGKDSNDFFNDFIIKVTDVADIPKTYNMSQQNLKDAKDDIGGYLDRWLDGEPDARRLELLDTLRRKITNGLMVNRYVVDSDAEAGVIFEVMNDRGKPLSSADKIKNYLIYLAYKVEEEGDEEDSLAGVINDYWGEIFRNLMASRRSSEDDFLRYHWIVYANDQKEHDVHRQVKARIRLKDIAGNKVEPDKAEKKVSEYAADLKESSRVFFELNQPESPASFSDDIYGSFKHNKEIRDTMDSLHRLGTLASFYPLLISARRFFAKEPAEFLELLSLCELFAFRALAVCNRRANTGQAVFYALAHELFMNRHSSTQEKEQVAQKAKREVAQAIHQYSSDDSFERHLTSSNFYYDLQSREIRYFFYELEQKRARDAKEEFTATWREILEKSSVEHIWPQSPKGYDKWPEKKQELHDNNVHRLGNLTITGWDPGPLGNKDFLDSEEFKGKRSYYKMSTLRVQRELAGCDEWGIPQIEEREKELVAFASERWPLPEIDPEEIPEIDQKMKEKHKQVVSSTKQELNEFLKQLAVFPGQFRVSTKKHTEEASLYTDFPFGDHQLHIWAEYSRDGVWIWVAANGKNALPEENKMYEQYLVKSLGLCDGYSESDVWTVCYGDHMNSLKKNEERRQCFIDNVKRVTKAIGEAIKAEKAGEG